MVANAGIATFATTIIDTPVDLWEKIMSVNARSVMLAIKHAARQMIAQGRGGRIIGQISAHADSIECNIWYCVAASSAAGKQGM